MGLQTESSFCLTAGEEKLWDVNYKAVILPALCSRSQLVIGYGLPLLGAEEGRL